MAKAEAIGAPVPGPSPSLYDLLNEPALKHPDRTALVCMHQPSTFLSSFTHTTPSNPPTPPSSPPHKTAYLSWTFSQLATASHNLALSLYTSGIRPGDRIVAFLTNGAEWHILIRASLELGCAFAPLNPKVVNNRAETRHFMEMLYPSVVLVQDEDAAEKLWDHAPESMENVSVKLISPEEKGEIVPAGVPKGWVGLSTFLETGKRDARQGAEKEVERIERKDEDVVVVLMTSGTTNLPKGCPITSRGYSSQLRSTLQRIGLDKDETRSSLNHSVPSHLMGANFSMAYHAVGLKVVHPAATFSASSSISAIDLERCTDIPAVPAIVHALIAHPDLAKVDTGCLKGVLLGATTILPETLRTAMKDLGAERACEAYGMTETGPCLIHPWNEIVPGVVPERVTSGSVVAEAKVRVCVPDSNGEVIERGVAGELHCGGIAIIKEYWLSAEKRGTGAFYDDAEGHWIRTGDQAVMDEDGKIQIVGRYKDMIIRGGENISPSAIESILLSRFDLIAELVALPDEIAGEIPIAIVKKKEGQEVDAFKLRELLVKELGAAWVPEEIIDVESLGIEDYPRTTTGKVQKNKLREILIKQRQGQTKVAAGENMLDMLLRLWTTILGLAPDTLTAESSVHDWADSLILARFSAILHREAGHQISLQELMEHGTLAAQAKLLSSRGSAGQSISDLNPKREGPPTVDDMAHARGDPARAKRTEELANKTLSPLGLSWQDVEDVIPMNSMQEMFMKYRRPQTSNHRHAWACPGSTMSELKKAIEGAVTHHSMLRTMGVYFDSSTSVHLTIRPSAQWFSQSITFVDPVKTAADLSTLVYNDPKLDYAAYPGPLFRFVITHIEDENCAGLIYMAQHSVFDGVSLPLFLEDLNTLLVSPSAVLKPHVPYKAWADNYYNLQDSSIAHSHVDWQVKRLHGISKNPATLFPLQRAPEWFKGSSLGWIDIETGKPGPPRISLDAEPIGVKGINIQGQLPDIQVLKVQHGIEGSQIVKAAIAVMTTKYTKQPYALFGQAQAGRTWPFLLEWQASRMPPAMDVDGPAVQGTLNRIPVDAEENILSMLSRLQAEQQHLNKHAYAPHHHLVAALDKGIEGEGEFFMGAFKRQIFNWLPVPSGWEFKGLRKVQIESRTDCGLLWNFVMLDQTTVNVNPTWDDAQLRRSEIEEMGNEILRIAREFATAGNWGKKVGSVI
ncbi:acetyl-CoA synthetase-like protein [Stipitochalara longipes BDJ]|nr:acetyl-CoA synthetase-like protein [Stipitochalara longipes BDJ]